MEQALTTQAPVTQPTVKQKKNNGIKSFLLAAVHPFEHLAGPFKFLGIATATIWALIFVYLWYKAPSLIPSPTEIIHQLFAYLSDKAFYSDVFSSLWLTIKAMLISILIASLISYASVTALFRPVATFIVRLRYMSLIGFLFTFMLILKDGSQVKTAMLVFGITPFFTLSLLSMITKITQEEYDLWTTLRYSRWEQLYQIVIKGKADYTIDTIRANFAMAWLMLSIVETFSMADGGLGVLLFKANKYNQLAQIFALQFIILGCGIIFDYLLQQLRYMVFPYTKLAEKK